MSIWDDIVGTAEDAWDAGTEWVDTNVVEPVKEKAVEIATDIKLNQIKNEVKWNGNKIEMGSNKYGIQWKLK